MDVLPRENNVDFCEKLRGDASNQVVPMGYYIESTFNQASRWLEQMTATDWFIAFVVVVVVGCFCMRGFGSRSNY